MNLSLSEVLALTGGKTINGAPEISVSGVATLAEATPSDVSFLGNEKYFKDFLATKFTIKVEVVVKQIVAVGTV